MAWRYFLPFRPAEPGAIPRGATEIFNYGLKKFVNNAGREVFGFAEYDHELTDKEISDYELIPDADNPLPELTNDFDLELEKEPALIEGDVLMFDHRMYCIENRVFPNYAKKWLKEHDFKASHYVRVKDDKYTLFEKPAGKPDAVRVAIPDRTPIWR